jgi:hypothetical protein
MVVQTHNEKFEASASIRIISVVCISYICVASIGFAPFCFGLISQVSTCDQFKRDEGHTHWLFPRKGISLECLTYGKVAVEAAKLATQAEVNQAREVEILPRVRVQNLTPGHQVGAQIQEIKSHMDLAPHDHQTGFTVEVLQSLILRVLYRH